MPAYAAVNYEEVYSSKEYLQYAVASSGVWLNENGTLKWFHESAYHPEDVITDSRIGHIASDGSSTTQVVYLTEEQGVQTLHFTMTSGTNLLPAVTLPSDKHIIQLENSTMFDLFALAEDGTVYSVYAGDGSLRPLSISQWINEGVSTIAVWSNYLLTYKQASGELTLIDLSLKSCTVPSVTVPSLSWVQIGMVSEDECYVLALNINGNLIRVNMNSGEQEIIETNLPRDCAGLRRDKYRVYTLGNSFHTLYALSINELLERVSSKTITIVNSVGNFDQFEEAVSMFHEKYPDIQIVERNIDDPRIIATEIMSGAEGIDIVGLQDSNMPISAALLLKSGALVDLNQFLDLVALKDEYRDIWGAVTIDGRWYAVPEGIEQNLWCVNLQLAEKIGWEPPVGRWTWDDFTALAEKVLAYNQTADSPIYLLQEDTFLLPYFFHEYQANHVQPFNGIANYMSDQYISLLKMWKQLNDDNLICSAPSVFDQSFRPNALLHAQRMSLNSLNTDCYIYPPTESVTSAIPAYTFNLALNANSPNLEEAAYFLTCYMSPESVAKTFYWSHGQWLCNKELYTKTENIFGFVSEANETLWNEALTATAPELYLLDIMIKQGSALLPSLLEGTISAEEFAAVSQQMADIVLGE